MLLNNQTQAKKPMFGGMAPRGLAGQPSPGTSGAPDNIAKSYGIANTATEQQAGDYGTIMEGYKKLFSGQGGNSPYQASQARQPGIANLANLAQTGGYDQQGISDLRSRAMSPIQSIYAGANREVDRQKGLQGGYSPNFAAVKAKMAREQSGSIGKAMTDVNAGIAQNVASNKLAAASPYASALGQQAGAEDEASQFNATQIPDQQMKALGGATNLYGTTPALVNTFGNQAQNAASLQNQIAQQNEQNKLNKIGLAMRS